MKAHMTDGLGYGLEVGPAKERISISRRLRLKSKLQDGFSSGSPSETDLTPEAGSFQLEAATSESRRLFERASGYVDRGQYPLAASLLRRVVKGAPEDPNAWYLLGFALGELGRHLESIECLDRVVELDPNRAQAYSNRGWQRLRCRDVRGAVSDLTRSTELDPRDAMTWSHLGLALTRVDRLEDAAEVYRRSVFLDTESRKTCMALASCLSRLGRKEESAIWRQKAFSLMMRPREPKPSLAVGAEYQRHAVGRVIKRESLVVDAKAIQRQKQAQKALAIAQNPVAWMVFLILVALLYVLLGN